MTKLLTPGQVQRYERDGFVHPVPVLSHDGVGELRRELEDWVHTQGALAAFRALQDAGFSQPDTTKATP